MELEILGDEALCGVSAVAVMIPAGLKDIGSRVFAESSICQVTFAGDGFTLDDYTFADTTGGLTVFCPDGDTADVLEEISGITVVRVRPSGGTQ